MPENQEELLAGGTLTPVVRVGNTVRRPSHPWTPTVHALLRHLHSCGFDSAPMPLGTDEQGREMLSFLDGNVANWPLPEVLLRGDGLVQFGRLLRRYHDAVATFVPPRGAIWQEGQVDLVAGQVVKHGDLGTWNTIWDENRLTGLIDWDFAGPGDARDDVVQALGTQCRFTTTARAVKQASDECPIA